MWNTQKIKESLGSNRSWPTGSDSQFSLSLFDYESKIGIGRDGQNNIVLVLPGQADVLAFNTEGAIFEPWTQVHWIEENLDISQVSTLKCLFDNSSEEHLAAVSAVFMGIIDLQLEFGHCGNAIWEMKALFESKFQKTIDRNIIVGLIGELLVIQSSSNLQRVVEAWHSRVDDSFDFSSENARIEVKTSTNPGREHHFSSTQINDNAVFKVFVASVILYQVEIGNTLEELFLEISRDLDTDSREKFTNSVIKILGSTPNLAAEINFDRSASMLSIRYFSDSQIPQPTINPGVISMNWSASLVGVNSLNIVIDKLLFSD
jgi:hypothetical protein